MKHLSILFFLISRFALSQSDDKLGIGVVRLGYPLRTLFFYQDTVVKKVKYQISFSAKEKGIETLSKNKWLVPTEMLFSSAEGGPLNFDLICLENRKYWHRVKVDPKSTESYWLHVDASLKFSEWSNYLKSRFCVRRISIKNRIHTSNSIASDTIESIRYDCTRVVEVKGYWLKIKPFITRLSQTEEKDDRSFGWVQWRNRNSLLIYYYDN